MKFNITYKLLLSFFLAMVVVVGAMLFLMKWSFEKGFLQYVNTMEQQALVNLADALVEVYKQDGNWDNLRDDRRRWFELQVASFMETEAARRRFGEHAAPGSISMPAPANSPGDPARDPRPIQSGPVFPAERQPGPGRIFPLERLRPNPRVALLDKDKNIIIGRFRNPENLQLKPIETGGAVIGYLGILPRRELIDTHDLQFTETQGHAFTLIALVTIISATLIIILPLSRSLVKPIQRVTGATRVLASGQYDVRIAPGSNDEIGQLTRDFNTLANTLEQNERARRQWIADISHELRTPLTILRGEVEAMQDGIRPLSKERVNALHDQILNLNRLVQDLYELSMSDIGALNYRKQIINLKQIIEASYGGVAKNFQDKHIAVELDFNRGEDFTVFADPDRLKQLFTNLLVNSCRYTDRGGELQIKVAAGTKTVMVNLMDSAPGVDAAELPRLFERLYRPDSSRNRQTGGAGLGLSICKNIVSAHDGTISAAASPLGGLWILVELPLES
jgi:two-component system sensor histidine kinase BaeS